MDEELDRTLMNLYPSVTEILSILEPLQWSPQLEAAALRGSTVHEYAATHARGFPPLNIPPEWEGYYQSFKAWYDLFVKEPISVEERLVSKFGFHGKPDLIFISVDDEVCLADYKTSAVTSRKWALQIAAYKHLSEENDRLIHRGGFVKLLKDGSTGSFMDTMVKDNGKSFQAFLQCLSLYRFLKA